MSSAAAPNGASRPHPRGRRKSSLAARLCAIVLGFESIVVFLGGLAVYGLGVLPETIPDWWGIVGGAILALAMMLTAGLTRFPWGIGVGWALQAVVAASAFLVPAMLLIFLIFGGMYAFAAIQGRRVEKRAAAAAEGE